MKRESHPRAASSKQKAARYYEIDSVSIFDDEEEKFTTDLKKHKAKISEVTEPDELNAIEAPASKAFEYCLLPDPVWDQIFRYSSVETTLTMSMVSRKMYFQLLNTEYFQGVLKNIFKEKGIPCDTSDKVVEEVRNLVFATQSKYGCLNCGRIDLAGVEQHQLANIPLCTACSSSDKYKLITATNAKKEYRLNDRELAMIDCFVARNPHYRNAAPMRLYWELEISNASVQKHLAKKTTLEAAKRKAEASASKRIANKAAKESLTRKELEIALQEFGLTIRSDSKLCQCYLTGRWGNITPMTAEQIALRMRTMHILHAHTDYEAKVNQEIEHQRTISGYLPRYEYLEMIQAIKDQVESDEMQRWNTELKEKITCLCNRTD